MREEVSTEALWWQWVSSCAQDSAAVSALTIAQGLTLHVFREQKMKLLHQSFKNVRKLEPLSSGTNSASKPKVFPGRLVGARSPSSVSSPNPPGTETFQLLLFISAAFPCVKHPISQLPKRLLPRRLLP